MHETDPKTNLINIHGEQYTYTHNYWKRQTSVKLVTLSVSVGVTTFSGENAKTFRRL